MCNVRFILILTPPWLQVKAAKYLDFWNLDVWRVAVCVRFSSGTTQPISPMMIPINWGNHVDVQCALHFDLDPSMTAGQGHKILRFCEFRFLTGSSLCLPPISMMIPINWGNNVDVQCALHFDLDPSMTAGQGHKILQFCEFRCLTGSSCVCFSSETTWPNSPMLMPIYRGTMKQQHILNFDLHPSMTAGQGHDILWFCEFWCLMGSSLCSLLLRNYSTDFSNYIYADTNLSSEKCRFATYTSFWPSPLHGQGHKILQFCEFRLLPWHECWYMSGPYMVAGDRLDIVSIFLVNFLWPESQF